VFSSAVGFEIYNQSKVRTPMFEFFLSLWGHGGPNWMVEEKKYYKEVDSEWQVVTRKKSIIPSFRRVSVFQRMQPSPSDPGLRHDISQQRQTANSDNYAAPLKSFPTNTSFLRANLPGLIPFFKFPSFKAIEWPDDSYLTWFRAHGPAPLIQEVSSFGDFSGFLPREKISDSFVLSASSHSPP
jgi:hypothetical protein